MFSALWFKPHAACDDSRQDNHNRKLINEEHTGHATVPGHPHDGLLFLNFMIYREYGASLQAKPEGTVQVARKVEPGGGGPSIRVNSGVRPSIRGSTSTITVPACRRSLRTT